MNLTFLVRYYIPPSIDTMTKAVASWIFFVNINKYWPNHYPGSSELRSHGDVNEHVRTGAGNTWCLERHCSTMVFTESPFGPA